MHSTFTGNRRKKKHEQIFETDDFAVFRLSMVGFNTLWQYTISETDSQTKNLQLCNNFQNGDDFQNSLKFAFFRMENINKKWTTLRIFC